MYCTDSHVMAISYDNSYSLSHIAVMNVKVKTSDKHHIVESLFLIMHHNSVIVTAQNNNISSVEFE